MSRSIAVALLCLLWFGSISCEKVPLLAPTDSAVIVSVNSTSVAINGTATVTAIVTESAGTAPQNGTQVTFTTTLGSIDPLDASTRNGRATATFHAGSRAGTATIKAQSGSAESETVDVTVGAGGGDTGSVALRIESASSNGTMFNIVATVLDGAGNKIPGAPVNFSADNSAVITPGFAIADANAEARAIVTITAATTVTARSGAAEGTLALAAPGSLVIVVTTPAPGTAAEVGQPVTFTVTPTGGIFTDVVVDFGDGTTPQNMGTISVAQTITHTYTQTGNFTVTAKGTTSAGTTVTSTTPITVVQRAPLAVGLTAAPNPVGLAAAQGLTVFTATATAPGTAAVTIARVEWSFGDGTAPAPGTSLTINHRYTSATTFVATVKVIAVDGREGTASTTVRVTP